MGIYIDNEGTASPYGSAVLDWRMSKVMRHGNYESMAEGYFAAASDLLASLIHDNVGHRADTEIFPVLFCMHQGIELSLKGLMLLINEADDGLSNAQERVPQVSGVYAGAAGKMIAGC